MTFSRSAGSRSAGSRSAGWLAATACLAALGLSQPAQAEVVVDTGAPTGYSGSFDTIASYQEVFGEFTATTPEITAIYGYFITIPGATTAQTLTGKLYTDNNTAPGTVVGSFTFTMPVSDVPIEEGAADLDFTVTPGQNYWIGFSATGDNIAASPVVTVPHPLVHGGFEEYNTPGFNGFYLTQGFMGLVVLDGPAAVPEPASWALMMVGFGLVGGGLRRRRRQAVTRYA